MLCEECNERISDARLAAIAKGIVAGPSAKLCITCQEADEFARPWMPNFIPQLISTMAVFGEGDDHVTPEMLPGRYVRAKLAPLPAGAE